MADVITLPAIQNDTELEVAVAEYLDAKHGAELAAAHKKARETQIKDYLGMASMRELSNGVKVNVSAPIIKNVFDSKLDYQSECHCSKTVGTKSPLRRRWTS